MENQLERVTAKTKNPKKVAAGKAAYAARKEKEAKMLKDLQEAKDSLHDPEEKQEMVCKPVCGLGKLVWITGLVGLGAVACYYLFQHKPAVNPPETKSQASILKTSNESSIIDPFYMQ